MVQEINNLSDKDQAEKIAENFLKIPNEYEQIKKEDVNISQINKEEIPQFKPVDVWMLLNTLFCRIKTQPGGLTASRVAL